LSYIVHEVHVKPIKDNLIESPLYFYKNEKEEKCRFWDLFPIYVIPQTNL